jgi:putative transposase
MKRSRFTEEQIIGILREQGAGIATTSVCREHGISGATFYKGQVLSLLDKRDWGAVASRN